MHGEGRYFFINGDLFDGNWKNNTYHGQGTFYEETTGCTVIADFVHGKIPCYLEKFSVLDEQGKFVRENERYKHPLYRSLM